MALIMCHFSNDRRNSWELLAPYGLASKIVGLVNLIAQGCKRGKVEAARPLKV